MTLQALPRLAKPLARPCPDHSKHHAGCEPCKARSRSLARTRHRMRAYGTWQPLRMDATPVREHLHALKTGLMSDRQIAERAGVGKRTISRISQGLTLQVKPETGQAILGVKLKRPYTINSIGVKRRLRALARARYSSADIAILLGMSIDSSKRGRNTTQGGLDYGCHQVISWRSGRTPTVRYATHEKIADLYDKLIDTIGESYLIGKQAERLGWDPFDAWTETTIDDPNAEPYSDPAAINHIDPEKLDRLKFKKVPAGLKPVTFRDLTPAEQLHLYLEHMQAGGSERGFRDKYRPVPITTLRKLRESL